MPLLNEEQAQNKVYGTDGSFSQRKIFRERLMDRFSSHEWVRVINPDDEDFYWQYLPQHSETMEFTPDGMQKLTEREPVEAWILHPGESEVIIGENAYVMIDSLYKKLVAKGYLHKHGPNPERNPGRNFNWSDSRQQEELIDKIFLGKETPEFNKKKASTSVNELHPAGQTTGRLKAA